MDTARFESLLRAFATTRSRRHALRALAGTAFGGLLGLDQLQARAKKGKGKGNGKGGGKKGNRSKQRVWSNWKRTCLKDVASEIYCSASSALDQELRCCGGCPGTPCSENQPYYWQLCMNQARDCCHYYGLGKHHQGYACLKDVAAVYDSRCGECFLHG